MVFSILDDNNGEEFSKTDMLQTLIQLEEHLISQFNNADGKQRAVRIVLTKLTTRSPYAKQIHNQTKYITYPIRVKYLSFHFSNAQIVPYKTEKPVSI